MHVSLHMYIYTTHRLTGVRVCTHSICGMQAARRKRGLRRRYLEDEAERDVFYEAQCACV